MYYLVLEILRSLAAGFYARRNLVLENLALRHQLLALNRKVAAWRPTPTAINLRSDEAGTRLLS